MLLIDAYNVLRSPEAGRLRRGLREAGDSDTARAGSEGGLSPDVDLDALTRLARRGRYAAHRVHFVCDGVAGPTSARLLEAWPGVRVEYAGPKVEADDVIERWLRVGGPGAGGPGAGTRVLAGESLVVVSSDRRVADAARRAGATALSAEAFLDHLRIDELGRSAPPAKPAFANAVPLDRYSVAHWLGEFGYDAGEVLRGAGGLERSQLSRSDRSGDRSDQDQKQERSPQEPPHQSRKPPKQPKLRPRGVASTLGERLALPLLPVPAAPVQPAPVSPAMAAAKAASTATPAASPTTAARGPTAGAGLGQPGVLLGAARPREALEPWISEALREWADRLDPSDLDMTRWLDTPLQPPERPAQTPPPRATKRGDGGKGAANRASGAGGARRDRPARGGLD